MAERDGKGKPPGPGDAREPTVAITIHVPVDVMHLLQDVALAHNIDAAAVAAAGHDAAASRKRAHSVASVIVEVLRRHLADLEQQARTVRGPRRT